ncbi:MaoC family dehydratase [Alkalihalophilus lindianensis]|uniref:MaoC family dehydratase n=1 Tax=Alkalihalophilus lindianensis TaxID=1630542 RepID=A0ABU3X4Z9_9BACI|nr:MaoC family dehydratase [Alkalihalophilus lindianensis]MDV2682965.1 MaoC family dehydratase [Alkalihalophilus lindianensis]
MLNQPSLEEIHIKEITQQQLEAYGLVSNDYNPIHFDLKAAQDAGFPKQIAHGMFTMGVSTNLVSPWISTHLVKSYETSFIQPLLVGDSLRIKGTATITDQTTSIVFTGENQHGETIIKGQISLEVHAR